jgi:hypothetical protein
MRKYLFGIAAILMTISFVAFRPSAKTKHITTKIYKYQESNASHVFDGVSPYWVEVAPGNECDPIDPELPCTVTIQIGSGTGEYDNLDEFLDQFSTVQALLNEENVTGKDE